MNSCCSSSTKTILFHLFTKLRSTNIKKTEDDSTGSTDSTDMTDGLMSYQGLVGTKNV